MENTPKHGWFQFLTCENLLNSVSYHCKSNTCGFPFTVALRNKQLHDVIKHSGIL